MLEAIIHTDGSSDRNQNGGWAAIVATPTHLLELAGWEPNATNNRMEMMAAYRALLELTTPHAVTLVSDSAYLLNTLRHKWYLDWFKESSGKSRPNIELWRDLVDEVDKHAMTYIHVKGHTDRKKDVPTVEWNVRADTLAQHARKQKCEIRHLSSTYEVHVI